VFGQILYSDLLANEVRIDYNVFASGNSRFERPPSPIMNSEIRANESGSFSQVSDVKSTVSNLSSQKVDLALVNIPNVALPHVYIIQLS